MKQFFSMVLIICLISSFQPLMAQSIKTPAASPFQSIKQDFGLSNIELSYSRPAMRGRTIFNDLVPYNKLWRTGANAATKIKFNEDVVVEGTQLKAGEYAIYSIPNSTQWEIILNKGASNWGIGGYKEEDDVARFKVPVSKSPITFENFTMFFDKVQGGNATLYLVWENTMVSFNIMTEIDSKIMTQIEEIMVEDKRPYFQSANYYYENDKDLNQALLWANKAVDQNPSAFWVVHLKAKIQAKLGDKKGATATAKESLKLAQAAGSDDYVALNLKLIDSLK